MGSGRCVVADSRVVAESRVVAAGEGECVTAQARRGLVHGIIAAGKEREETIVRATWCPSRRVKRAGREGSNAALELPCRDGMVTAL